jgi:hypothetical protein
VPSYSAIWRLGFVHPWSRCLLLRELGVLTVAKSSHNLIIRYINVIFVFAAGSVQNSQSPGSLLRAAAFCSTAVQFRSVPGAI